MTGSSIFGVLLACWQIWGVVGKLPSSCDLVVAGAGPGGAFAAWHAAEAGKKVCVLESNTRPGGRIHSIRGMGSRGDLVVEAGAYRFAPKPVCEPADHRTTQVPWCIHTPITAASVLKLGLNAGIYDPDPTKWDHHMRVLRDEHGHNIGYLTLVEKMLERAEALGAEVFYSARVTALEKTGDAGAVAILVESGERVEAKAAIMNMPQGPLLKVLRNSGAPFATSFPGELYATMPFPIMKFYIHYDDAWWINDLNHTAGAFSNAILPDGSSRFSPMHGEAAGIPMQLPVPLEGQYHDGDVRCDLPGGRCRGYIQAFYGAGSDLQWYRPFHGYQYSQESALQISNASQEHRTLLADVHTALVELHREQLDKAGITKKIEAMQPNSGVMSIWSELVSDINTGCHMPKAPRGKGTFKVSDITKAASRPFPEVSVYVANEAWGVMPCFAEGSLNMSAQALHDLGVPTLVLPEEEEPPMHPPPRTDPFLLGAGRVHRGLQKLRESPELVV